MALARLRRDIERQKRSIQESLERFLRSHREEGVLQEEFVTIRNERFVVPIIAGQRRKLDGVIHGTSASGHTLFVEPIETIDLNNELVRLTEEEMREVYRILVEITSRLRGYGDSIRQTLITMAELELIFAKGRFATEFGCTIPRFGDRLLLRDARHPLLEDVMRRRRKEVVPIGLELNRDRRTLLISGPNTGGKTVSLKTLGLLTLMAQSGIPVPAAEAEFPVFSQVLADIGDYQSIQENLSTFSAHVTNIREMALDVTPDSLVLLDELGSATDPEEGGALGVAIVEHFRAAGAFTLISTHLMALKIYGASTEGVVNGSMGFDERDLRADVSPATGAAGKIGRPGDRYAAGNAGRHHAARPPVHERPRARRHALPGRAAPPHRRDCSRWNGNCATNWPSWSAAKRSWRASGRSARRPSSRSWSAAPTRRWRASRSRRRRAIGKIAQGADKRKAEQEAQRRVAKAKRELRDDFATTVLATQDDSRQDRIQPLRIEEGVRVRLRDVRDPALVRRKLGNGRIEVEAGFMKMQVSEDDVIEVLPEAAGVEQAAAQCELPARAGAGAGAPGDQRDRPARRGSARRRGRIPGSRRDGHRQPRPHRARPRHGRAEEDDCRACWRTIRTWPSSTRPRSRKAAPGRRLWS